MSLIYINSYQFASAPPVGPTDPDFASVSLLLHGDGTNGSTTIVDSSPLPKTVTAYGNAQISTANSKFGGASLAFDGTGDSLSIGGSVAFSFGGADLTIEGWVNPTVITSGRAIVSSYPGGSPGNWIISLEGGKLSLYIYPSGTFNFSWLSTTVFSVNTWTHFAITRESGFWRMFCNGVMENTSTASVSMGNLVDVTIGSQNNTTRFFNGYIDDFRITKGVARYTANFTPPTAPFPDA